MSKPMVLTAGTRYMLRMRGRRMQSRMYPLVDGILELISIAVSDPIAERQ